MKRIRLVLLTLIFLFMIPLSVSAMTTYKSGDKVEIISAMMPEDGTKITFTIPQGNYPKNSKIVIYGEKNVYCPVPGIPTEPKSPDKNPFTLLSEYTFSETDIKALATGDATFITTMKFDVQCGDIYGKILSVSETAKPSETQANRPTGGDSGATDTEGNPLVSMIAGSKIDTTFTLTGNVLTYVAPQGSYTLGDYLIVFNQDKVAIAKTVINQELMDELAKNPAEIRSIVDGVDSIDGLHAVVSDVDYDLGTVIDVPVEPANPVSSSNGLSPILIGVLVFVVVAGGGLGVYYLQSQKKAKK